MASNYIPIFEIYKGGENITARFQDRATEIKVELKSGDGEQDSVTITVDDRDWLVARPQVGDFLEVRLGYKDMGVAFMNVFEVDEVTFLFPPKTISIHGNAQGNNSLLKVKQVKEYKDKTIKEILEDIGGQAGLSVQIDKELGNTKIPFLNNIMSTQNLISQLEQNFGAVAKISNGQGILSFTKRDSGTSASGSQMPRVAYTADSFADIQVKHTQRSNFSSTVGKWRDKKTTQLKEVESKSKVQSSGNSENADALEPHRIDKEFSSEQEAKSAADAIMGALDRGLGEASFTLAKGDPWLRDQTQVLIRGTRDGIDGSYVIDLVTHHYTKQGGIRTSAKSQGTGTGQSFEDLYTADPSKFLSPPPGKTIGDVLKDLLGQIIQ